ncbi:radical SAM protein [candidate division KSB1 bacterium]|nr:radical SAM protein [candidate division KSB1 bacterium]
MLSFSFKEMEKYTKPLCSAVQYEQKVANFKKVFQSFTDRNEFCNGLPIQMHVEPSGACNLYCPICPRGRGLLERDGFLSLESFARIFDSQAETLANIVIGGFGEPLLNDEITQIISHSVKKNVSTFMNTNGTLLQESAAELLDSGLTRLNISLDGAASISYHAYNEVFPFENTVKGVATLRALKEKGNYDYPQIHGQIILDDETVDEIDNLERRALSIGVENVWFKRSHFFMPAEMMLEDMLSLYDFDKIIRKGKAKTSENLNWTPFDCSHPWDSFFLGCNGKIGMCSFDPHQYLVFATVSDNFSDGWNSNPVRTVRRWHSEHGKNIGMPCLTCNRVPGYLFPVEKMQYIESQPKLYHKSVDPD